MRKTYQMLPDQRLLGMASSQSRVPCSKGSCGTRREYGVKLWPECDKNQELRSSSCSPSSHSDWLYLDLM